MLQKNKKIPGALVHKSILSKNKGRFNAWIRLFDKSFKNIPKNNKIFYKKAVAFLLFVLL